MGRDIFSAAARDYAALAPVLWDPIGRASAQALAARPGDLVVDACCGVGSSALPLAAAVGPTGRVDAIDLAPGLVDVLQRDPQRPAWLLPRVADVLTYDAGQVDRVCCVLGLPFFADPAQGLTTLSRMLRPGGRIAFTLWRDGVMSDVYAAAAAARRTVGAAVPSPASARVATATATAATIWAHQAGLCDLTVTPVAHRVPADPRIAWGLVMGSGFRALAEDLSPAEREAMRIAYLRHLGPRPVDASVLVVTGTRN